ncbi:MAG: hypothetical protein JXB38_22525 [Anaerolineales bacterium]|nr:hypothetical protein [Anaerolineales bacterium]
MRYLPKVWFLLTLIIIALFAACSDNEGMLPSEATPQSQVAMRIFPATFTPDPARPASATPTPNQQAHPLSTDTPQPEQAETLAFILTVNAGNPTLLAKTETAVNALTSSPTNPFPPTATSTPQPPLKAHTWEPEPILVNIEKRTMFLDYPPDLALYGDGLLILSGESEGFQFQPVYTHLNRKKNCKLLNTIDQLGYLDYDPSTYNPRIDVHASVKLDVNAWNSTQGEYLILWDFIDAIPGVVACDDCPPNPQVLPALKDTYHLLMNYTPGGMKTYQPDDLLIFGWEHSYDEPDLPVRDWPLADLPLEEILKTYQVIYPLDSATLSTSELEVLLENLSSGFYQQGDRIVEVFIRPLWPHEANNWNPDIPDTLECKIIDGTLTSMP